MNLSNQVGHRREFDPRYLIGLIVLAILCGSQAATQFCAERFNYAPELGPWHIGKFYPLWHWPLWAHQWKDVVPLVFRESATVAVGTFAVIVFLGVYLYPKRKVTDMLHGSARWATRWEIWRAGLMRRDRGDSVVVGAIRCWWGGLRLLRHGGLQHVLCFAPTGAGKGVGLVLPTLLTWTRSIFVTDLKGELYQLTAGFRSLLGHRVYRFAPGESNSVAWNPLNEIRKHTDQEMGDVQLVALLLVDPEGEGLESHWQKTAWMLLTGLILYSLHIDDGPTTLQRVDELLSDPHRPIKDLWSEMVESDNQLVARFARDMLNRPDEEAGSVLSTAQTCLALYRDPVVAKNTRKCDFFLNELMRHPKAHALYLVTQPPDKDRLKPLVRLLIAMAVRTLSKDLEFDKGQPKPNYRHALLMMLDEFPSLGKIGILEESLAFLRGYGIKCYLICQDTVQLEAAYGKTEAITSNCHVQVVYAPNRPETAERVSRMLGKTTVRYKNESQNEKGKSSTTQWVQRPLLTADEVQTLPGPRKDFRDRITKPGDLIVFVAGKRPIYGVQPLYFRLRDIARRSRLPATIPAVNPTGNKS